MIMQVDQAQVKSAFNGSALVSTLKGVGPQMTEKLARLQIYTVGDLLLHCPFRYEDHTRLTPLRSVFVDKNVLIQGEVVDVKEVKQKKRRYMVTLRDNTGTIELVFFHYYPQQQKQWQKGAILRCFGQAKWVGKTIQMVHPDFEIMDANNPAPLPERYTPIYPAVEGLSQKWLRTKIKQVLTLYLQQSQEADTFKQQLASFSMLPLKKAFEIIHSPTLDISIENLVNRDHPAYLRLIVEELFAHHLSLQQIRTHIQKRKAQPLIIDPSLIESFLAQLPFKLTAAQARVWQEIAADLSKETPMLRLVQGDVGCGKTLIAILAALVAASQGMQVAVMVPTEILAQQHYEQFDQWLSPLGYRCERLVSKLKSKEKRSVLENITLGLAHIVIGTQALFQENIQFKTLGLVIVDEQHRFGVSQRLALQLKSNEALVPTHAHQLMMTATPIPRTLAMSHYAHLDISTIDVLPPGREPVITLAIPQSRTEEVISRMANVCAKGQQIYWICTLIAESETLQCQAVEVATMQLQAQLPDHRVTMLHGKMEAALKEEIMTAFYRGEIDVLVSTTVIEVGVNVPNAALMIIENPERFGLAQLHQLRGRVGRGSEKSYCILLYQSPLSKMAQARLQIMRETTDGFVISEEDLKLRGPGEVLGVRQTGLVNFKVADFYRDQALLRALPQWSEGLKNLAPEEKALICQRWGVDVRWGQA